MFNNELLNEMIKQFGSNDVLLYCKMESAKNDILYKDCVSRNEEHVECIEYDYERDWWNAKHNELFEELDKQTKKTRYEWTRTIG